MEFRILGPLEVLDEGEAVVLGTLKERLVLAVLLLHANEFVSRERLIDDLWGASPPPTARKAINVYLHRLRKVLARDGADPIATAAGGYRLRVDPDKLDVARLQQLLEGARNYASAGELESAAACFREALSLWRGPTLAGLQLESLGRDEVAQLDELRLAALMDRIDCDLALGRQEEALRELNVLVREHPLRERLRAQQMLALYRADRQADALDAYAEARQTLVDDLGIEPSEALQRLQQAILRHDASLETAEGTASVNGLAPDPPPTPSPPSRPAEPASRRRFRPRRWQLALAGLVILAGSAAAAALLSSSAAATPRVVPNSLVELNPRTGKPISVVRVGVEPGPITIAPGAIWTLNEGHETISRYDLHTHTVQTRGGFPYEPFDVVADATGNAWLSGYETPIVARLAAGVKGASARPLDRWQTKTIHLAGPAVGNEAVGGGYLWATVGPYTKPGEDDRLSLIDLASNKIVDSVRLGSATTALAFGHGAAWVGTLHEPKGQPPTGEGQPTWLYEMRTAWPPRGQPYLDRHRLRQRLGTGAFSMAIAIAVGDGSVWVLQCGTCGFGGVDRTLLKVDPSTLKVLERTPLLGKTSYLAAGAGSVWLTGQADGSVWQVDPKTAGIVRAIHVGRKGAVTCGVAATPKAVWVAIGDAHCFP